MREKEKRISRLIDADRLQKDILDLQNCYNGFSDTYDKACIIGVIDEQPTIDPVKRGRWVKSGKGGEWWYACSMCEGHIPKTLFGQDWHSSYCPNCGARMEGEEDEF